MSIPPYRYRVFGLTLASELELSELQPLADSGPADVTISLGMLADDLPQEAGHHAQQDGGLLVIEGVGRFLARDGRSLQLEPVPNVPGRNLRLFVLGSGLGMILHQRGLLPLHANAVVIAGHAYAFTGPSGAGKSTLATWFWDHGYPLLCDDVCVIGFDAGGTACAWPGLPRVRLWQDALERSGRPCAAYQRSFVEEGDQPNKFDVPLIGATQPTEPHPLGGVLLLDRADEFRLERLSPADSLATLFANIYRGEYLGGRQHEGAWRSCLQLAAAVPVYRWARPWRLCDYDGQVASLVTSLRAR